MRRFFSPGLATAVLLATAVASADTGSIVLVSGQILVGEITQVVEGEYIMLKLPSGEVKAIAWAQIGSFQIGGSATVSTGNPTTAPPVNNTPPPVYTPPPPPPNYYNGPPPPPPPPPPRPAFNPAFMAGVRVGSISPSGYLSGSSLSESETRNVAMSEYSKSGVAFEADLGIHFSPAWTFYGFWEYGMLGRGSENSGAPDASTLNTLGIGMNVNSTPNGPVGFYADLALGYRWFNFSEPGFIAGAGQGTPPPASEYSRIVAEGFMPLRIALGLAIAIGPKARLDLAGQLSLGTFTRTKGGACPDGCDIPSTDRGTHITTGLVAGIRWDL